MALGAFITLREEVCRATQGQIDFFRLPKFVPDKKLAEEREYDRVRLEVTRFKSDVLNLYRTHVESLSRLPEFQQKEETPAQDAEAELPETEDADTTEEAVPAADAAETEDAAPEKAGEDFWEKDESQLKLDPPPADPNAVFQGVSFSE